MFGKLFSGDLPKPELDSRLDINRGVMEALRQRDYEFMYYPSGPERVRIDYIYFYATDIFPDSFGLKGVIVFSENGITTIRPSKPINKSSDYVGNYAIGEILQECTEIDITTKLNVPVTDHSINRSSDFDVNHYPYGFDSNERPPHLYPKFLGQMIQEASRDLSKIDRDQRTPAKEIIRQMEGF